MAGTVAGVAALMGLEAEQLAKNLLTKRMVTRGEAIDRPCATRTRTPALGPRPPPPRPPPSASARHALGWVG